MFMVTACFEGKNKENKKTSKAPKPKP